MAPPPGSGKRIGFRSEKS